MVFIEKLYSVLLVVFVFDFIATIFVFRSKPKEPGDKQSSEMVIWTWKDNLWMGIMFISLILLMLLSLALNINYNFSVFLWIILIYNYTMQTANTLSCVSIVGAAISKDARGNLNKFEHQAILMLTALPINLFSHKILEKVHSYVTTYPHAIYSDWMTFLFYFVVISVLAFFISALTINPISLLLKLYFKCFYVFSKGRIAYFGKLQKFINGEYNKKTFCSAIIECGVKLHVLLRMILWIIIIPVVIIDILKGMIQLIILLMAAIVWYVFLILSWIFSKFNKLASFVMSLSDRSIIAICFRVSIVVGLGCTVIINRYEPLFRNQQESTAVLEFISSVIIIPIVYEWISSYTKPQSSETSMQ